MPEIHLTLSLAALEALARGEEIGVRVDDEMSLVLVLDVSAQRVFQESVYQSLMAYLPTPPQVH